MYAYETHCLLAGSVQRSSMSALEKGMQRPRTMDSLILGRLHRVAQKPELLLYASADGQRPQAANLFGRTTVLNSLSDLWNAVIKEPRTSCCYAQIVDDNPLGHNDVARTALELSLLKVKPFDLSSFENLLEVQERIYGSAYREFLFIDPLQKFVVVEPLRRRKQEREAAMERQKRQTLMIEAYLEPLSDSEIQSSASGGSFLLRGRDCQTADFRKGLQGVADLFKSWSQWLGERAKHPGQFSKIFVYSQVKGLLPACWEELRVRGVAADQVRLPQWAGYSNALSTYWEFLLTPEAKSAAFIHIPMNGRCHFAEWGYRN